MNGQKKPLESDNRILSPDKLSGMMTISGKGVIIIVVILLLVVAGVYIGLFSAKLEQSITKAAFYEGPISRDQIIKTAQEPEWGGLSVEETEFRAWNLWKFREDVEELSLFSAVISGREYDRISPVLGLDVIVDGRIPAKVALDMVIPGYEDLYGYGFMDEDMETLGVWPGERAYYLLTILADEVDPEMEIGYHEIKIIVRNEELKSLLYVPAEKETN